MIAVPFVPDAWMAVALWLLRAFFVQMDAPTSQSYTMAVFMMTPVLEPSTSSPATCRKYGRISQR